MTAHPTSSVDRATPAQDGRAGAAGRETLRIPGLVITEHEFSVPLEHPRPDGEHISVFAREVADPDGRERPFLVRSRTGLVGDVLRLEPGKDAAHALVEHQAARSRSTSSRTWQSTRWSFTTPQACIAA